MNAKKLLFLVSSLFLLVGCMPDSFTKFKENPPAKKTTSGGTSSSSSSSSGSSSSSSSGGPTNVVSWTQYEYLQANGDEIIIKVTNPTGFNTGQTIWSSSDIYQAAAPFTGKGRATITQVDPANNLIVASVVSATSGSFFEPGDYIDNCATGYGGCTVGTSNASPVEDVYFNLDSSGFTRAPTISYTGTGTIDYYATDLPPGIRIDSSTGTIYSPAPPFAVPELSGPTTYTVVSRQTDFVSTDDDPTNVEDTTIKFAAFNFTPTYSYDLYYRIEDNDLIRLDVASTTGIVVGDTVSICANPAFSGCNEDSEINARAVIYYIDSTNRYVYLRMQNETNTYLVNHHRIRRTDYIHKDDGTFNTIMIDHPTRLYTLSSQPSLVRAYEGGAPGAEYFDLENSSIIPAGILNTSTGTMTFPVMSEMSPTLIQVNLFSSLGGTTIGSHSIRLAFTPVPTGFDYPLAVYNLVIGTSIGNSMESRIAGGPGEGNYVFSLCPTLVGACATTLPAGLTLDSSDGSITGVPTSYDAGTNYTVYGYHPDTSSTYYDSFTMNIAAGTQFTDFTFSQLTGSKLVLRVDDASAFSSGDNLSNDDGGLATIDYVDVLSNEIFITIGATSLTGNNVFKKGDKIDNSTIYAFQRAEIKEDVVHVFDKTDDLTAGIPTTLLLNGSPISLAGGETLTYVISPNLNPDFSFNSSTGTISGNSALGLIPFEEKTYLVTATSRVVSPIAKNYVMTVTENPADLSLGSYQFIRVTNTSRFNVGQRFATQTGIKGRILQIISNEGMLVQADDIIPDSEPLDNVPFFVSSETTVRKYAYLYLDTDPTGVFINGDSVSTPAGDVGVVEAVYADTVNLNYHLYVRVTTGEFSEGEVIDDASTYVTKAATITNANTRNFANTIITLTDATNFPIGSYISSTTGAGIGKVIYKTGNTLYVLAMSGYFAQGDSVDNRNVYSAAETTIASVQGPNVQLTTTAGHGFAYGSNITADNAGYQAAGSMHDKKSTDAGTALYMTLENGFVEHGDTLDDVNPFVASGATVASAVGSVKNDNTLYLYSGEKYYLPIYLKGSYTNITIDPELPVGLSIDKDNAVISGTPTAAQDRTTHTLTVRNGSSFQNYTFDVVVYAQFRIIHGTANASSYLLHKEGRGYNTAACRITKDQVDNFGSATDGVNNINCRLEAEEMDLTYYGASFSVLTSPGMCEYVRYRPVSYWTRPPGRTSASFIVYEDFSGDETACGSAPSIPEISTPSGGAPYTWLPTAGSGTWTSARSYGSSYCDSGDCFNGGDIDNPTTPGCHFNYSGAGGPNCDDGSYTLKTVSCAESSGVCDCTVVTSIVQCGGSNLSCMAGPVRDMQFEKNLSSSATSAVTDTFAGTFEPNSGATELKFTISAPGAPLQDPTTPKYTNAYLANWVKTNACLGADGYTYDSDNWAIINEVESTTASTYPTDLFSGRSPFYAFECLDAAQDVKARIRVQIRDWDRKFTASNDIDLLTPTGLMDAAADSCFGVSCNNENDMDDMALSTSGATLVSGWASCGNPSAAFDNTTIAKTISIVSGQRTASAVGATNLTTVLAPGSIIYCNDANGGGATDVPFVVSEVPSANSVIFENTPRASLNCDDPTVHTQRRHNFLLNP